MKKEELFEVLEEIDPSIVGQAREYKGRKRKTWVKWTAMAACAALIVGVTIGQPFGKKGGKDCKNPNYPDNIQIVLAAYPEAVNTDMTSQEFLESEKHFTWWKSYRELVSKSQELQPGMQEYYWKVMQKLLPSVNENTVCSPLNTYLAMAMVAEVSGGNTRQQILSMLGVKDINALRENVSALWGSNYVDTPALRSNLANSLWLNDEINYNEYVRNVLAEQYRASSFCGEVGSAEMNQALRKWTDDNTGGLLSEYTKEMALTPDAVFGIVSTIYYKAIWKNEFKEDQTVQEIFHGISGDTTVDMMKKTNSMSVYATDCFTSVALPLHDSGSMYFVLPDENTDVNALVSDPDLWKSLRYDENDKNRFFPLVHLSVPKFKVSGKTDLLEAFEAFGVTDALDPKLADFTPLTTDRDDIFLNKAEHAAMIEIDEYGVTGAAYTEVLLLGGAAMPKDEIDVVLDRPFLFLITGADGSVLFAGVVRNIG